MDYFKKMNGMNRAYTMIIITALGLAASAANGAQTVYSAAERQNPLDNAGHTARAMAMGSAFVAVSDDVSAILWNPAGLALLGQNEISAHHTSWLGGIFQEVLMMGLPLYEGGTLGFTGNYLGYGSFEERDEAGFPAGSYPAGQMGLGVGWGSRVTEGLYLGAAFHATQQVLSEVRYSLFGGNLGALLKLDGWGFGASYSNQGLGQPSELIASSFRLGMSRKWVDSSGTGILAGLGWSLEPNLGQSLQAGLEGVYNRVWFLRVGYDLSLEKTAIEGVRGLTTGIGLTVGSVRVDYAFLPFGDLGNTHHVSMSYWFGGHSSKTAPVVISPALGEVSQTGGPIAQQSQVPKLPELSPLTKPIVSSPSTVYVQQTVPQVLPQAVPAPQAGVGASQPERTITMEFDVPAESGIVRAKSLAREKRWVEAVDVLKEILKRNPKDATAWWELGNVYFGANKKEYAVYCFEKALELKPDNKALADWIMRYKAK
jgi:hypothetical protein